MPKLGLSSSLAGGSTGANLIIPSFRRDFAVVKTLNHGIGPDITFTRTGTATYFDANGTLTTATADVPRFDHNPSTLESRGLLIEEGRTNSIRNSQAEGAVVGVIGSGGALPTNWFPSNATGFTYEIIGTGTEAGIPYVDVKISGTNSSGGLVYPRVWFESQTQIVAASGQTWTNSFYAKIVNGGIAGLSFMAAQVIENDSSGLNAAQNVTNISLTSSLTRFSHTRTLTQATTTRVTGAIIFEVPNGNSCNLTLRIAAPQLEQGAFATSYIPTTSAAVTRGADRSVITPISSFYNQTEGALFVEFQRFQVSGNNKMLMFFDPVNTARYLGIESDGGVPTTQRFIVQNDAGSTVANMSFTNATSGTNYKLAGGYSINNFNAAQNGTLGLQDNSGTPTSSLTHVGIGCLPSTNGQFFLNGHIRKIAYYPRRLSNAQLQALTT